MEEPLVWEGGSRECCPPPCLFTLWQVHLRGALWLRDMRRNSSVNTSDIWHINKLGNTPAQAAQVNSDLLSPGVKSAALEMEKSAKCLWKGGGTADPGPGPERAASLLCPIGSGKIQGVSDGFLHNFLFFIILSLFFSFYLKKKIPPFF